MAFYDKFPYTNFQELNLDWLTQEVSKVRDNRDASDASAAAALASEKAAKASETAAAASQQAAKASQQAAKASETAAAGSEAASAEYLDQIGTHTAGAVADWLKENLTTTTPPIDATLTVSGAAADAKKTGDLLKGNNLIETSKLKYGFIQSSDGTIYSGGSSYKYSELIPVNEGDIYLYYARGSSSVLVIGAYETETGNAVLSKSIAGNDTNMKQSYVVPPGIKYIRMTDSVYYDEPLLIFLKNDKYARGIRGGDFNDFTPSSTPYIINYGYNYTNSPRTDSGILYCYEDFSTNIIWQMFIPAGTKNLYMRRKINNTWESWSPESTSKEKEISILFVGNSLTQDGIAYLPYLLKTYYPEVKFRFYMWYNGALNLNEQYNYFINDKVCDIFSLCANTVSWTNYNSEKKMSEILSSYTFDVVCMQEYFNFKTSYTESDLIDWNNCKDYIASHYTGGNPLEFISLFHAPKRSDATAIFNRTVEGNNLILQKTIAQDMIATGIAVYRALSTELANLGDQGNLSPDGTHTQEGLPCLLQTYVAACWLLDKLGIAKSVYGCPMRMTTDIYNTLNVPGANIGTGVITGTDAQNLLAQEVAIKAYKEGKYYVNNNIFKIN